MAGAWHKFMVFLGLGEEELDEYVDDHGAPVYDEDPSFDSGLVPEPPQEASPRIKTIRTLDEDEEPPEGAVMRREIEEPRAAERLHVIAPSGFNDAKDIGDNLKRDVPVIINLVDVDRDLRRRLVDFSSGLAYAISGKMERVAENVFLITPANIEVSAEERRRMRERGLFSTGV